LENLAIVPVLSFVIGVACMKHIREALLFLKPMFNSKWFISSAFKCFCFKQMELALLIRLDFDSLLKTIEMFEHLKLSKLLPKSPLTWR